MADGTALEQCLELIKNGKTDANEIADEVGCSKATVYAARKVFAETSPATAIVRRSSSAVAQPVEGGGDEGDEDLEQLRVRVTELTEFALDTAMENARLKRIIQGRG